MKYFAVEHKYVDEIFVYLYTINPNYLFLPVVKAQFATVFHNKLSDEDFLILRLKYNILVPTLAQLKLIESIYKISLNLDEYSA